MSLKSALQGLPDDRETHYAIQQVLGYVSRHPGEQVDAERVATVTGVGLPAVRRVFTALSQGFVVDCGSGDRACKYTPSPAVRTEVDRFLVTADRAHNKLRGNLERFRGTYSRGR